MTLKTTEQPEIRPFSPRVAGAVFFTIYALLFTLFTKYTLLSLRDSALLPLLPSLLVAVATGAFAGGLFGKALAKPRAWPTPFLIGILLACLSLILGSLAILAYYYLTDATFINHLNKWQDYFVIYGVILLSLFLTIGLWLIPLTGLVALYFNRRFFPGLLAVDQKRLHAEIKSKVDMPDE